MKFFKALIPRGAFNADRESEVLFGLVLGAFQHPSCGIGNSCRRHAHPDLVPDDRMGILTQASPNNCVSGVQSLLPDRRVLFPPSSALTDMKYDEKIVDRQVGRNADMFARAIGEMKTPEERYPYIRILISIIEQAHPEWNQAPTKDRQISVLMFHMSKGTVDQEEVAEIVRLRDEERGYTYIERRPKESDQSEKSRQTERSETAEKNAKPKESDQSEKSRQTERSEKTEEAAKPTESEEDNSPADVASLGSGRDAGEEADGDAGEDAGHAVAETPDVDSEAMADADSEAIQEPDSSAGSEDADSTEPRSRADERTASAENADRVGNVDTEFNPSSDRDRAGGRQGQ